MNLAKYIEHDLTNRIYDGEDIANQLTLGALAKHYGVSITPVRQAVMELIDTDILLKEPNGRLAVSPSRPKRPKRQKAVESPPDINDWEDVLVQEVMQLSLRGEGIYLREIALAEKFCIGRSVIRQALSRLSGAGLIEYIPRCGWLVHQYSEDDMRAYLEVREALELMALDLSRPNLVREELIALLECEEGGSSELSNDIHDHIVEKSGNRYIRDFFRQHVARYYSMLFHYAAPEAAVVDEMTEQHRRLLEALISESWTRARSVLSEHIWAQERVLGKLVNK